MRLSILHTVKSSDDFRRFGYVDKKSDWLLCLSLCDFGDVMQAPTLLQGLIFAFLSFGDDSDSTALIGDQGSSRILGVEDTLNWR
jgi:hypothetical protein